MAVGPSLLFVTLPRILQDIPMGQLFAVILYTAMVFAGVSSLQNMFEAVGESLQHRFPKLSRKLVLVLLAVICLGFGLHMEPIFNWGPWMDIVSIYICPFGALLAGIMFFWVLKKETALGTVNQGSEKSIGGWFHFLGKWVYCPLCLVALIAGAILGGIG